MRRVRTETCTAVILTPFSLLVESTSGAQKRALFGFEISVSLRPRHQMVIRGGGSRWVASAANRAFRSA
jgi:hypothetical protein